MVEVLAANDAVMAKNCIVRHARTGERAGMRSGGASSRIGAADLGEDHWLAHARRLLCDRAEPLRVADPFEIAHKDVGAARIEHPIEIVVRLQHGLIAGADLISKTQLPVAAAR